MFALIVDDSRAMRRILKQIVEPLGFETIEAGNGLEALHQLQEHPDVTMALVDWNMPEMNGLEFVQVVRADPRYESLKLVMVTTETEPTRMARALMAGVDEFVMKPFTSEILLDKLRLIGVTSPAT
jgi:two-component system chemotaxis response regulator CheY